MKKLPAPKRDGNYVSDSLLFGRTGHDGSVRVFIRLNDRFEVFRDYPSKEEFFKDFGENADIEYYAPEDATPYAEQFHIEQRARYPYFMEADHKPNDAASVKEIIDKDGDLDAVANR